MILQNIQIKTPCCQTKVYNLKDALFRLGQIFKDIHRHLKCQIMRENNDITQECLNVEALWSNKSGQADILH